MQSVRNFGVASAAPVPATSVAQDAELLLELAPRLVFDLPACVQCHSVAAAYLADAPVRTFSRERAQYYAALILGHHTDYQPAHSDFYIEALYRLEIMSHADRLYAAICMYHSASASLDLGAWCRDLTADGDIEPNPGPVCWGEEVRMSLAARPGRLRRAWHGFAAFLRSQSRRATLAFILLVVWCTLAHTAWQFCNADVWQAFWRSWLVHVSSSLVLCAMQRRTIVDARSYARTARDCAVEVLLVGSLLYGTFGLRRWFRDLRADGDVESNPGPTFSVRNFTRGSGYLAVAGLAATFARAAYVVWNAPRAVVGCPVEHLGRTARWVPRPSGDFADCQESAVTVPVLADLAPDAEYEGPDGVVYTVRDRPHGVGPYIVRELTPIGTYTIVWRTATLLYRRAALWVDRVAGLPVETSASTGPLRVGVDVADPLAPTRIARGTRVTERGPIIGLYRWAAFGGDVVVVVVSHVLGPGAVYHVCARDWAALASNAHNSQSLDAMTVYHERGHEDRGRALVERAAIWTADPPLLRRGGPADNAAFDRKTKPNAAPNVATERTVATPDRPHAAIGNETVRVETSDEDAKGFERPLILCPPIDGVCTTTPGNDASTSLESIKTRLVGIEQQGERTFTPLHAQVIESLLFALRAAVDNEPLTFAFVEQIREHFLRPSQKINFERGTGSIFDALVEKGVVFVKQEHLKLKVKGGRVVAGDPRNITSTPNIQVAGLTIIIELVRALSALGITCGGYTMEELCERLSAVVGNPDGYSVVFSVDANRCDGRTGPVVRAAEELIVRGLWEAEGAEDAVTVLRKFYNLPCERRKPGQSVWDASIKYRQGASRASGSPDTYYGNTLSMAFIAASVSVKWGLPLSALHEWFAAAGDDSVWRFTPAHGNSARAAGLAKLDAVALFKADIAAAALFWGHVFEFDEPAAHREYDGGHLPGMFVPFLGRFFHGLPLTSFADPRRKIKSFNHSATKAPVEDVATGKGLGMAIDKHTYPWAYIAAAVSNMHATGRHRGLSQGDMTTILTPHLPYHLRAGAILRLPEPARIGESVDSASIALWEELCPGYDASPIVQHCMRWAEYSSVASFYAAIPPLRVTVHTEDSALTRVDGEWLEDVEVMTAERASEYLKEVAKERSKLRRLQEEEEPEAPQEDTRVCNHCGEIGHIARACPRREDAPREQGPRKCYNCRAEGHEARNCPAPRAQTKGVQNSRAAKLAAAKKDTRKKKQ